MITAKEAREMKTCSKCKEEKNISDYTKNKSSKDGLCFYCKSCAGVMKKGYYDKMPKTPKGEMPLPLPANSKLVSEIPEFAHVTGYAIDINGNCWSCLHTQYHFKEWFLLSKKVDTKGYPVLSLTTNGKRKYYRVHRLMALLYLANPENKSDINHKNGIRTDNSINNLEWCTRSENMKHAYDVLNHPILHGIKNPKSKLDDNKVREIRNLLSNGLSLRGIAKVYGTSPSIILGIKHNKRWSHVI